MTLFCAAIKRESVSRDSPSLAMTGSSCVQSRQCVAWSICIVFFPFLFSEFCFLLFDLMLTQLFAGCCNQSFFLLFLMCFSNPYIDVSTPSSMPERLLPPSFHDTKSLCHLSDVRPCVLSAVSLILGLFVRVPPSSILRVVQSILQRGFPTCLFFSWDFCCRA